MRAKPILYASALALTLTSGALAQSRGLFGNIGLMAVHS